MVVLTRFVPPVFGVDEGDTVIVEFDNVALLVDEDTDGADAELDDAELMVNDDAAEEAAELDDAALLVEEVSDDADEDCVLVLDKPRIL